MWSTLPSIEKDCMVVMNARFDTPVVADGGFARIVSALRDPACYPHPVARVELVETHISWVMLTGEYAYKIKKPVNLGFLDFTSLAARRHFCEEELRLNRRLAPDIYLETVTVTGDPARPRIGGRGPALEYAVKMRQFPQSALLDAALERGEATAATFEALAYRIANFHAAGRCAALTPGVDAAASMLTPVLDNFEQMLPLLDAPDDIALLGRLREWTVREHQRPANMLGQRLAAGRIRECHGDLHLGNIALIDGEPTPFDCIEFDPALRWMDVMSEVAFLAMDLETHGRSDLAYRFLNTYLEHCGDYDGVALLPFYLVYRAVVRAKTNLLRAAQPDVTPDQRDRALAVYAHYLSRADAYTRAQRGAIIITHGLAGCGKTALTQPLIAALGAIRVRSDVERKRLHGFTALARTGAALDAGIYTADAGLRTYGQLAQYVHQMAGAGFPVIVDAAFLKRGQRTAFLALARGLGVPFAIVDVAAPHAELRARVAARAAQGDNASEATLQVLEAQIATHEPLSADELACAVTVDAHLNVAAAARTLCDRLAQKLQQPPDHA